MILFDVFISQKRKKKKNFIIIVLFFFSKPPYESIGALQSLRVLNLEGNVIEKLEKRAFGKLNILAGNYIYSICYYVLK